MATQLTADQFRRIREATKMTLEQFGKMLGISAATAWRKEQGSYPIKPPEAEMLRRVAEEHGVRLN